MWRSGSRCGAWRRRKAPRARSKTSRGWDSRGGPSTAQRGPQSAARAAGPRCPVAGIDQGPGLTRFLSARENVELGLALRGVEQDEGNKRALEALARVGLAERAEQRAARLSAGERQRVAIARAVAAEASFLLADEPTARLDEANALAVGALFATLARDWGAAVVVATHDPLVVEQADAILALS